MGCLHQMLGFLAHTMILTLQEWGRTGKQPHATLTLEGAQDNTHLVDGGIPGAFVVNLDLNLEFLTEAGGGKHVMLNF